MKAAMVLFAAICVVIGVFPGTLYGLLPFPVDYVPYTATHVVTTLQLLVFGGVAFLLVLPYLMRTETITLDTDWLWRGPGRALGRDFNDRSTTVWDAFTARSRRSASLLLKTIYRHHGPSGVLARTWPTGSMAFWATLLLAAYLVLYYF
jgi:multicomponent Na+:H+ antiporter subunit D